MSGREVSLDPGEAVELMFQVQTYRALSSDYTCEGTQATVPSLGYTYCYILYVHMYVPVHRLLCITIVCTYMRTTDKYIRSIMY